MNQYKLGCVQWFTGQLESVLIHFTSLLVCAVRGAEGIKRELMNRAASVSIPEKYCHHINVLSSVLSAMWQVLAFWGLFWCSNFFLFGWRCVLMKRCKEIWGLRKKANTWSLFLEFRCSSKLKINGKRHDFQLCLPFPPRPLTHTHTHTHSHTYDDSLAGCH